MDRLAMLRQMVQARPNDPFARYGLAMELAKRDDDEATEVFEALVADHPGYVASYLMFGNYLVRHDQPARAADVFERGMAVARAANEDHAYDELAAARAELP